MRQQKLLAITACLCSVAVVLVSAVPLPAGNQELDMLQIPLSDGKELDVLTLGAKDQEQIIAERNKRTIGLLRELFPDITKQIDDIVNRIIGQVIRVAGPSLLPALLGNNRPTTERSDFDADFDDDDDTSNEESNSVFSNSNTATPATSSIGSTDNGGASRVNIVLPTFPPVNASSVQPTTAAVNNVSFRQGATVATTSVTASTATTTAATVIKTTGNTATSKSTIVTTISPKSTTDITTTTSSRPIEIPNTPTTATTTTISAIVSTIIPTTPPMIPSSTALPTTTIDSIFVIPRVKPQSTTSATGNKSNNNNIPNVTTAPTTLIQTENPLTIISTLTPTNPPNTPATKSLPMNSSSISDILNIATPGTIAAETLPTPTIPVTYLGRFDGENGVTDTQIDLSAINKQLEETIRVARQVKEAEAAAQAIAQQQQQQTPSSVPAQLPIPSKTDPNAPIQLSFNNEVTPDSSKPVNNDLRLTESKSPAIDELTLDSNEDATDLDDRNKRFLSFGGAGVAGGSGGNAGGNAAAGGGSGNFLFDIIRLFSGSVQTQAGDEAANSANSVSGGDSDGDSDANRAADGYTEGIPGPVTRLVVLANRGLANLIQDLILRIAATSEKFVNFKAKLITALI